MATSRLHLFIVLTVDAFTLIYSLHLLRQTRGEAAPSSVKHYVGSFLPSPSYEFEQEVDRGSHEKLAYATFLTGTTADASDSDSSHDRYFVATRILAYQLLHAPETRTNRSILFLVLVTDDISQSKRDRLTKDGAIIVPVAYLQADTDWIKGEMPQWRDVMTKLRAWELTQYSRILFLDGDTILTRPLDGVFDDPAAQSTLSLRHTNATIDDEAPVPSTFVLATMPEANPFHAYPPTTANNDFKDPNYFNAGFFVFAPSRQMFEVYTSLMKLPGRFNPRYPEQNLLDYAHRKEGNMAWRQLDTFWNIRFPSLKDYEGGVGSLHDKWWHPHMDQKLAGLYSSWRWKMEGFYEALDAVRGD
ncbi:hypothetical protein B0A49_03610 [Cryomyces minteri]|uniref:Nucleotide-diphospho-sugar transferase n=1 Tax=Cryomyces minteri TaxID=331657 RepID=A0A4U0XH02_9PEZI|nr:hypothetical protein B0A49_03610 [Cryomyces minteri]